MPLGYVYTLEDKLNICKYFEHPAYQNIIQNVRICHACIKYEIPAIPTTATVKKWLVELN